MTTLKTAVYQTISSLALDVLLSKLASLILFQGALFSGVDGFSSKLEKKKTVEGSILLHWAQLLEGSLALNPGLN